MNDVIKSLAATCGFKPNPDIYDRYQSFDIDKFAQLMITEFRKVIDHTEDEAIDRGFMVSEAMYLLGCNVVDHFVNQQVIPINSVEPHICPFKAEINGDYETLCNCSEEQEYECRMDI